VITLLGIARHHFMPGNDPVFAEKDFLFLPWQTVAKKAYHAGNTYIEVESVINLRLA